MRALVKVPELVQWKNGVIVQLQGDTTNLNTLQNELKEVKQMVNKDANRQGLALKDVNISIEFIGKLTNW